MGFLGEPFSVQYLVFFSKNDAILYILYSILLDIMNEIE